MTSNDHFRAKILARLDELGDRMQDIEKELDKPKSKDLGEQAIDLEDDEVLETLGVSAQREVRELREALKRITAGTYGICAECEEQISFERLDVVPQARLCKKCATKAAA